MVRFIKDEPVKSMWIVDNGLLKNAETMRCLDSSLLSNKVVSHDCSGNDYQRWEYNSSKQFVNQRYPGYCLEKENKKLRMKACSNSKNQKFRVKIKSSIVVYENNFGDFGNKIKIKDYVNHSITNDNSDNRKVEKDYVVGSSDIWKNIKGQDGSILVNMETNQCLEAPSSIKESVTTSTCNNQRTSSNIWYYNKSNKTIANKKYPGYCMQTIDGYPGEFKMKPCSGHFKQRFNPLNN